MLNENIQKFLFLNFFRACQRRNIRLMTLSGLNMIHDATFKLQLLRNAFPVESCLFHLILHVSISCSSIPSLPKYNLSCLRCLPSMRTCTPRITTFVVRRSRVPKNEISFGTLAGVPWGCTKPLACCNISSAKRIPQHLGL